MLRGLGAIPRILAQTWAPLLAWYLAGSLVRAGILALAAPIGPESALSALLLVPIAVLARLVSYVGMFLVLRRALRGYRALAGGDVVFTTARDTVSEFVRVLLASIGLFFTLYAIIGLLFEDLSAYAQAAYRYSADAGAVLNVGDGPIALAVVVIAFTARMLLKFFAPRLPDWMAIVEIYLEATWVFVALTAVGALFGPVLDWISSRQVVRWWNDLQDAITGLWDPIRVAIESLGWITPVVLQVVFLPLAWLFIASVVYLRALGNVIEDEIPVPAAITARVRLGVRRVPALLRRYRYLFTGTWDGLGRPLVFSARFVLRAGILNLAVFLAAYGLLYAAGQWLVRGVYSAVGAQDFAQWLLIDPVISAGLSAILEPIRVVLLAAAFDYCLQVWARRRMSLPTSPPSTLPTTSAKAPVLPPPTVPAPARI